jgi:5'-3' exonuclease
VPPASSPDYLALVGDSADGVPGLKGWGAKTAAAVLARYGTIEAIPDAPGQWDVAVRSVPALAATLAEQRDLARRFKELATLRTDPPVIAGVDELRWTGPTPEFSRICAEIDAPQYPGRAAGLMGRR